MSFAHPTLFLLFAASLLLTAHVWISLRQPTPYMDELFHIPQALAFCRAALTLHFPPYHPSITTLPGLYVPPALLSFLTRSDAACQPRALRLGVALAALFVLLLLASTLRALRVRGGKEGEGDWDAGLVLWLHPVFLFYAQLYYTDVPAMLLALVTWRLALAGRQKWAALAGLSGTLMRQTNMVWHAFVVVDVLVCKVLAERCAPGGRPREGLGACVWRAMQNVSAHAVVGVVYVGFVAWNGGPAIGDREHHAVSVHYAMYPYFAGFHAVSFAPFQMAGMRALRRQVWMWRRCRGWWWTTAAVAGGVTALVVATGGSVHPFVLADNRHFTFYVYRWWLLRGQWRRLVVVPVYVWGLVSPFVELHGDVIQSKGKREDGRGVVYAYVTQRMIAEGVVDGALHLCAAVTLVASPLMEPRYFVIASTFLAMRRLARQRQQIEPGRLRCIATVLVAMNVALMYVFAEMPFARPVDAHMPGDVSPGRFMF